MKVFLDANILFSASNLQSRTATLLAGLIQRGHETVTSVYAWGEVVRNVNAKCPHWLGSLQRFREHIDIIDVFTEPLDVECEGKDEPILAGAIGTRCTHLWTSDKAHFGRFYGQTIHGVTVISSVQMLELLAP